MALNIKKEVVAYGTTITLDCTVRIVNIRGNKIEIIADCDFTNNDNIIDSKSYLFIPSLEGDNLIKQGYEYLKSLPEYVDAVDC